ncbi:nucleotidyltransferase [Candidatus Gracilibacteria bacterium]|nr:nucleotidyltransferase [Candidatus Gracilibacteria bacterium]
MRVNLIPMAGIGSRFVNEGYKDPKPLIDVSGQPMIIRAAKSLPECDRWIFVCRTEHLRDYPLRETLEKEFPGVVIIDIDYLTEGQASTCLLAKDYFDLDDSLVIGACDNGMIYEMDKLGDLIDDERIDSLIFSFRNNVTVERNPKMYGWINVDDDENVSGMSVKVPISDDPVNDHAVVGSFWFRRAGDFVEMVESMIDKDLRINNEFYVDKVFDEFVAAGKRVKVFEIDKYICWGTPNDLKTYQYWKEYFQLTK